MQDIRVLVVDDEEDTALIHASYVDRIPGFCLAGIATSGRAALQQLSAGGVDLLLLDIGMPDMSGLEVLRRVRVVGADVAAIIVSSVRDMDDVSAAIRLGVMHYLLKPFTFLSFKAKLNEYAQFEMVSRQTRQVTTQREIDAVFGAMYPKYDVPLPKNLAPETLRDVVGRIRSAAEALTAEQCARRANLSRASARRYLEHLVETGLVIREPQRTGHAGRPTIRYRWHG